METKPPRPQEEPPEETAEPRAQTPRKAPDKYRGSRQAAERSRARYGGSAPRPLSGADQGSARRGFLGPLVILGSVGAVLVLVALAVVGRVDLSGLVGPGRERTAAAPSSTAPAPTAPTPTAPAPAEKPSGPAENEPPPTTLPATPTTLPAQPPTTKAPAPGQPSDPLQELAALGQRIIAGDDSEPTLDSFEEASLKLLARAVEHYGKGLSDQGNQVLAELDRLLSQELLDRYDRPRGLVLTEVKTVKLTSDQGQTVLLIKGRVENGTQKARNRVLLRAELKDGDKKVLAKSFTLAGRDLAEPDLYKPSATRRQTLLDTDPASETVIGPGASAPFLFVFSNPPGTAKRYGVRVVLAPEGGSGEAEI